MNEEEKRRSAADAAAAAAGAAAARAFVASFAPRASNGRGGPGTRMLRRSAWEYTLPVVEEVCAALGRYLAAKGPQVLRERLIPKFLEAFGHQRGG
jgi:hypothetical protein